MKTTKSLRGMVGGMMVLSMLTTAAVGQNLVVSGTGSFSGTGTIQVRGNVNTSAASAAVAIPGAVELTGTAAAQDLGVSGQALNLQILRVAGTVDKTMTTNVAISDSLIVNNGAGRALNVADRVLTLGGASQLASGSLNVSNSSSEVVYNRTGGTQTALGLNYGGRLTFAGTSAKNLGGAVAVAGNFSHSGGDLTVGQNLAFSTTGGTVAVATVADVLAGSTVTVGTAAANFAAITANHGTITAATNGGAIAVTNGVTNDGQINAGAGGMTIGGAATNQGSGSITGGAGAVSFAQAFSGAGTSTATAGTGGFAFNNTVTLTGGTLTGGAGSAIDLNGNLSMSAGTVSLSGTGTMAVGADFAVTGGTVSFAPTSAVTYDAAAAQTVYNTTYGNLTIAGSGAKTAAGDLTVQGTSTGLTVNTDLALSTFTLTMDQAGTAVSGPAEITGRVRRAHAFTGGTSYAFNRPDVTMALTANGPADITLGMFPGTEPAAGIGTRYARRQYTLSSATSVAANNLTAQLHYLDAELQGAPTETRLGLYKYSGGAWSKLATNGGAYTRNVAGDPNTIRLSNINEGLSGITEIGLRMLDYITVADGGWNTTATWGSTADDIPAATDDATVRHNVTGLDGAGRTIANLTIQDDAAYNGRVNVDANTLTVATVTSTGTIDVASGATLAVSGVLNNNTDAAGASTISVSGTANLNGAVTNAGTFTVNGATGVANVNAAFSNAGTLNVNMAGGRFIVNGFDLTNSGSITNNGVITVQ